MKKLLCILACILVIQNMSYAQVYDDNYQENPNYLKGKEYLESAQYSSAITEFKKAVRSNPRDESALIELSNAYNLRAKYYNDNIKEPEKAILDVKSALFFNKYFRQGNSVNLVTAINQMEKNLSMLEKVLNQSTQPDDIAKTAKSERMKGEFAAAAYDYFRISNDTKYKAQANSALGDIYKIFNRADRSILFYQNSLAANPDDADVHLKLARVYEDIGDYNSSLKEYGFALNTSSEREDILNSLEKIWQKKVDENPNDAESHANLGVVYQKQKRYNEALNEYKKAESLNPNNTNTKLNIGTLYQEQKKYDYALGIYNSILQTNPNDVNVLLYKAKCLKELGKNEDAVNTYKSILKIDSKNATARTELFGLLKDNMPVEDLLAFLYQNVLNSPNNSATYYEFAYELHKAGKIDDAISYYTQSIKMDKNNIDAYINLSQCYRQKQNYDKAYSIINKAAEIQPENALVKEQKSAIEKELSVTAYNSAANAYESGDYEQAIEMYSKVKPQTIDSLLGIAASYQAMGALDKAVEYYNSAMAMDSNNADIPYYIAGIYSNRNDFVRADKYLKIALAKNPSHSQAKELQKYIAAKQSDDMFEQAIKAYEEEKYLDAISILDKIAKINSDDANVYYYRALANDGLKNYTSAINDYKKAYSMSPQLNITLYSIAVDYDSIGNYASAKEYYQRYINSVADDNEYKQYAKSRIKEIK